MFKKLLNKYKNNRGEIGIETAAVMLIFVPIICTIIFGGYAFFTAQSKGIDLNYDTGRYVAMTGCSIEQLQEMDDLNKYASYSIAVREGENTQVLKADGSKGSITISCQPDSKKGDEFEVYTSMVVFGNTPIAFMPEVATRNGIYVQEQGDYHDYTPGAPTFAIDYVLNDSEEFPAELPEDAPHEYKMDRNTPLKNPSRYGYDFLGWYDNSSFTGERITYIPAGQTGDKTLYAKWEYTTRTYNVYYVSSASGIYLPKGSPVSSTITGQFGTSKYITPYDFNGYTTPEKVKVTFDDPEKTILIYYDPIEYTISYVEYELLEGKSLRYRLVGEVIPDGASIVYTIETPTINLEDYMFNSILYRDNEYPKYFEGWYSRYRSDTDVDFYFSEDDRIYAIENGSMGDITLYGLYKGGRGVLHSSIWSDGYKVSYLKSIVEAEGVTRIAFDEILPEGQKGYDVSENQDESVIAYVDGNTLRIGSICGKTIAPHLSDYLLGAIDGVTSMDVANLDVSYVQIMLGVLSADHKYISYGETKDPLTSITGLSTWDTSKVSNMSHMFADRASLITADAFSLDTSSAVDMSYMFCNTGFESLVISNYDTSKVANMEGMFKDCANLKNVVLTSFDTSGVMNMKLMFSRDYQIQSLDLRNLDTSSVTNMEGMFGQMTQLQNLNVSSFDTSNVTDMSQMFYKCSNLPELDLNGFNTTSVTNMSYMFYGCSELATIYASYDFVVDNVTSDGNMFAEDYKLAGGFGFSYVGTNYLDEYGHARYVNDKTYALINTASVDGYLTKDRPEPGVLHRAETDKVFCSYLKNITDNHEEVTKIYFDETLPGNQTGWDVSDEQNNSVIAYIVDDTLHIGSPGGKVNAPADSQFLLAELYVDSIDISNLVTSDATSMEGMFAGSSASELVLDNIDTRNVTNFANMFYGTNVTSLDLTGFDTSNAIYMNGMFHDCYDLTNVDLSSFNTSNVTTINGMFYNCKELKELSLASFDTSKLQSLNYVFYSCQKLEKLDLSNFDTSNIYEMKSTFWMCYNLAEIDISSFVTSNVRTFSGMFYCCKNLSSLDLSVFDTSNATDISSMFYYCGSLEGLNKLDFDTSKVTTMFQMFGNCSFEYFDLSNWDLRNTTSIGSMFDGCAQLKTVIIDNDAPELESMFSTFYACTSLKNVTLKLHNNYVLRDLTQTFMSCVSLEELDLTGINTANVVIMFNTFNGCYDLKKLNISTFDTANVSNMYGMFSECTSMKKLDLSSFNTSKVTVMQHMFREASALETIYVSDDFVTTSVTSGSEMFENNYNLVGGNGTAANGETHDASYARIDKPGIPGYFTAK